MINLQNMNELFELISKKIRRDITCYAFGGNAMMQYGYKDSTKDIDLLFEDEESREEFIRAITLLGYEKTPLKTIYSEEKQQEKNKPLMFKTEHERFDLFLKEVFQTKLSKNIKERVYGKFDYVDKNMLSVLVFSKEDIILMKSITDRAKDFEDIVTIVNKEKTIDWKQIVEEAVWQAKHGDTWVILDLEETMQRLKEHTLIRTEIFDLLHSSI